MTVKILDFYADWCGPCKTQDPILEQVEKDVEDIEVQKINVDNDKDTANEYQVRSLPTVVILADDGSMSERFVGVTQKEDILTAIKNAR